MNFPVGKSHGVLDAEKSCEQRKFNLFLIGESFKRLSINIIEILRSLASLHLFKLHRSLLQFVGSNFRLERLELKLK